MFIPLHFAILISTYRGSVSSYILCAWRWLRSWENFCCFYLCTFHKLRLNQVGLTVNLFLLYTRNTYLATRCGNLSPVGLRTGWVTIREYCLTSKGPYVVLSFLLLLFCVLCGVIVNSVLKSRFSIISASGFRKRKKQRTNMARCSSPENYYSSGRNTELELCRLWSIYRRGNRQTKKSGFSTV